MSTVIRTLTAKDAGILARSVEICTVFNGTVERHGLRWQSPALRDWELIQRRSNRSREVEVRIDELNLFEVYVDLPVEKKTTLKAVSVRPLYTRGLSLYEHKKLKAGLKEKDKASRFERMADEELYRLRLEYHAALGRQGDPVSLRQLEKLRDQLLARSAASANSSAPLAADARPTVDGLLSGQDAGPGSNPDTGNGATADRKPKQKRAARQRKPAVPDSQQTPAEAPAGATAPLDPGPPQSQPPSSRRKELRKPTYASSTAKRIPQ